MSIFVDENETFPIVIYWKGSRNEKGDLVSIDVSDEEIPGGEKIEALFCQASADTFGDILENSTIISHIDQKPILRSRMLRDQVLLRLMKSWSLDKVINLENICSLHVKISNKLFVNYMNETKLAPIVKKIIEEENKL